MRGGCLVRAPVDVAAEVAAVDVALTEAGTRKRAEGAKAYLKSDLDFYGVDAKGIRAVVREVLSGTQISTTMVSSLWFAPSGEVPAFEMRAVAVGLCERDPACSDPKISS